MMHCIFSQDFDGEEFLECIKDLLRVDKEWVPRAENCSLYVRPTMIGTEVSGVCVCVCRLVFIVQLYIHVHINAYVIIHIYSIFSEIILYSRLVNFRQQNVFLLYIFAL